LPHDEPAAIVTSPAEPSTEHKDRAAVEAVLSRISPSRFPSIASETFSALLQRRAEPTSLQDSKKTRPHIQESHASSPHHIALGLLTPIIQELESSRNALASTSEQSSPPMKDVPLAVLSVDEWRSLTRLCVRILVHYTHRCHDNV